MKQMGTAIVNFMGKHFQWVVDLWDWGWQFVDIIKGDITSFGPYKTIMERYANMQHSGSPVDMFLPSGIRDVNYQWVQDFQAKHGEMFPLFNKGGELVKFAFWCFGYTCSGGGGCQGLNDRQTCNEYIEDPKNIAKCVDKVGEDSQGACATLTEEGKDKCQDTMPFHTMYTGCNWEDKHTCIWKQDVAHCFNRVKKEICTSINTRRCGEGSFLIKSSGCSWNALFDTQSDYDYQNYVSMRSRSDGGVSWYNYDPTDPRRCCNEELHGNTVWMNSENQVMHLRSDGKKKEVNRLKDASYMHCTLDKKDKDPDKCLIKNIKSGQTARNLPCWCDGEASGSLRSPKYPCCLPACTEGLEESGVKERVEESGWYNQKNQRRYAPGKANQLFSETAYLDYSKWKCTKAEAFEVFPPFTQEQKWMQGVLYRHHTDENGVVQSRTRNLWKDVVWKGAFLFYLILYLTIYSICCVLVVLCACAVRVVCCVLCVEHNVS